MSTVEEVHTPNDQEKNAILVKAFMQLVAQVRHPGEIKESKDQMASECFILGRITNQKSKRTLLVIARGSTWEYARGQVEKACAKTLADHKIREFKTNHIQMMVTTSRNFVSRHATDEQIIKHMLPIEAQMHTDLTKDMHRAPDDAFSNGLHRMNAPPA